MTDSTLPTESDRKNVLCLSPQDVYPPTDGGKRGIYYSVINLAKECKCYFAFFHSLTDEALSAQTTHFSRLGISCLPIYLDRKDSIKNILISLFRMRAIKFSKYHQNHILNRLIEFIRCKNIDIVLIDHAHIGWYGRELKKHFPEKKIILREHNIEYDLVKQYAQFQHNPIKKTIVYAQYLLTRHDEISTWQSVNKTIFISDSDVKEAQSTGKLDGINWAIAYEGRSYTGDLILPIGTGKKFLYSGGLKLIQNAEMIRYFIQHYWQPFIASNPPFKYSFDLTSNTEEDICHYLSLTPDEIEHLHLRPLGFVPDFQQAIATHTFFLSPTNFGSGIRVKVVEAMSQGALVMMSTLDYNSCKFFEHKKNVLLYTSFEEFVDNIHFIEEHPEEAAKIRKQAYSDAKLHFNWQHLINEILQ